MDKEISSLVKAAVSADVLLSASKSADGSSFEINDVNYCGDADMAKDFYKSCPVIKALAANEVPSDILSLFEVKTSDEADRFKKLLADGQKFLYTEDEDGSIAYDFIFYKSGEYYK